MKLYKDIRNGNHYIVGNLGDTKYIFNKVMKFTMEENRMQYLRLIPYDPLIINDILEGVKSYLVNDINDIEFEKEGLIMSKSINMDLTNVIRLKLGLLGEKVDENKENKVLYVAHSCNLLNDTTIQSELDDYVIQNNLETFDKVALNEVSEVIFNKHILNENSNHSLKNKSEVFRRV